MRPNFFQMFFFEVSDESDFRKMDNFSFPLGAVVQVLKGSLTLGAYAEQVNTKPDRRSGGHRTCRRGATSEKGSAAHAHSYGSRAKMLGEPHDVLCVPPAHFRKQVRRQFVQFLFKKPVIGIARVDVAAPDYIAQPKHQEKIAVHTSAHGVT